jgi:predicted TIM-barrel fold metal-dependent hydrolase
MSYAKGRRIHDADSHFMEPDSNWLGQFADEHTRRRLRPFSVPGGTIDVLGSVGGRPRWTDMTPPERAVVESNLLQAKGWNALGSSYSDDRSVSLDLLGFSSQLVFPTFALAQFYSRSDPSLMYGGAQALNRAMAAFCEPDERLLPVGYLPMIDPSESLRTVKLAVELGCRAVWVPGVVQGELAHTHPAYLPIWEHLAAHHVPFVVHIGGDGGRLIDPKYHNNGIKVRDFIGGGENVRSKDYFAISHSAQVFLAAMILDGVFERLPNLRGGCIEIGAVWVVGWIRSLDIVQQTFQRNEPALKLPMKASEYVARQIRFTPFVHEPVGWMIDQTSPQLYMFSSDYPHPEGGRDPLGRFEASLGGQSEAARSGFYADNFEHWIAGSTA